jgi:hypothetical protein
MGKKEDYSVIYFLGIRFYDFISFEYVKVTRYGTVVLYEIPTTKGENTLYMIIQKKLKKLVRYGVGWNVR